MLYRIEIQRSAAKQILKINGKDRQKITDALYALALDPYPPGSLKLKGKDARRIRVGDYRIIYEVFEDKVILLIVAVGHRKDIYRHLH